MRACFVEQIANSRGHDINHHFCGRKTHHLVHKCRALINGITMMAIELETAIEVEIVDTLRSTVAECLAAIADMGFKVAYGFSDVADICRRPTRQMDQAPAAQSFDQLLVLCIELVKRL